MVNQWQMKNYMREAKPHIALKRKKKDKNDMGKPVPSNKQIHTRSRSQIAQLTQRA